MAINWSTLAPIQAPQVMGSIPYIPPQQSQADSLAGGIMQGLQQADQMKTSAIQRSKIQQDMDQSKQLFPSQLQASQNAAQLGNLQVQKAQNESDAVQAFRDNLNKGYEAASNAMTQIDPVAGVKMKQDLQDLQTKQGQAAEQLAKGTKAQLDVLNQIQISGGNIASESVTMATDPQTKQIDWNKANAIYQQRIKPLMQSNPDLAKSIFPPQLTAGDAANLKWLGGQGMANLMADKMKNQAPTNDMQNASVIADLRQKKDDGTITPVQQKQLDAMEALTAKNENGTNLQQNQDYIDQLQTQYDKLSNKNTPAAKRIKQKLDEAQSKIEKETQPGLVTGLVNKAINYVSGGSENPNTQAMPQVVPNNAPPSQADLEFTAKKYGMSVDDVKKKLGIQ